MNPEVLEVLLEDGTFSIPVDEHSRPYDSISRLAKTNLYSFPFSLAKQLCMRKIIL